MLPRWRFAQKMFRKLLTRSLFVKSAQCSTIHGTALCFTSDLLTGLDSKSILVALAISSVLFKHLTMHQFSCELPTADVSKRGASPPTGLAILTDSPTRCVVTPHTQKATSMSKALQITKHAWIPIRDPPHLAGVTCAAGRCPSWSFATTGVWLPLADFLKKQLVQSHGCHSSSLLVCSLFRNSVQAPRLRRKVEHR